MNLSHLSHFYVKPEFNLNMFALEEYQKTWRKLKKISNL